GSASSFWTAREPAGHDARRYSGALRCNCSHARAPRSLRTNWPLRLFRTPGALRSLRDRDSGMVPARSAAAQQDDGVRQFGLFAVRARSGPGAFFGEHGVPVGGQVQFRHLLLRRSEEHTSELQSRFDLVCRLLLEKKKSTSARPGSAERTSTCTDARGELSNSPNCPP